MQRHIIAGNGGIHLLPTIQQCLGEPEGNRVKLKVFSDGEHNLKIEENVRNGDVYIVQSVCAPSDFHFMQLALLIDAAKRASADRITAVIPYYGYARQDRKSTSRVPISAKAVAIMLEAVGANRVMAIDLHCGPIQGFFQTPVDNLFAVVVLMEAVKHLRSPKLTVVSPDAGGVERARGMAKRLNAPLAIIDKRREEANVAEIMHIIGDVEGRDCLMVDDLIDTAGTLCKGATALMNAGALSVSAACTHGVLSGMALDYLHDSPFKEVVITDTIPIQSPQHPIYKTGKIRRVSIAPLLAQAIHSTHTGESVSLLFDSSVAVSA